MPNKIVIFDHVWKKFERGERHNSLRDLLPAMARRIFKRRAPVDQLQGQEFWALQDVSFDVGPGQALGIIGPNGAGKSTALKLLTRIMRPTRGTCAIAGRVGALIEVAAGFHPDLTGRENVFLQGAVMGMKRTDIVRRFDRIVDFSGLQDFIDVPVKRYSSGMNARLGFSIAANLEPEALVIDEVLAVGDLAFQQKCIDRMQEFKQSGVAIVFVSHNLQAVADLCDRAILLGGGVKADGTPQEAIRAYVASAVAPVADSGMEPIETVFARLLDDAGRPVDRVQSGANLVLRVQYAPKVAVDEVIFDFLVHRSSDNLLLYEGHFTSKELGLPTITPMQPFEVDFGFRANMTAGDYRVVTRIRDILIRQYLAQAKRPSQFAVHGMTPCAGVADLEAAPLAS
jgi:lipopolysaccharide transport system ATP-binding protein